MKLPKSLADLPTFSPAEAETPHGAQKVVEAARKTGIVLVREEGGGNLGLAWLRLQERAPDAAIFLQPYVGLFVAMPEIDLLELHAWIDDQLTANP